MRSCDVRSLLMMMVIQIGGQIGFPEVDLSRMGVPFSRRMLLLVSKVSRSMFCFFDIDLG